MNLTNTSRVVQVLSEAKANVGNAFPAVPGTWQYLVHSSVAALTLYSSALMASPSSLSATTVEIIGN